MAGLDSFIKKRSGLCGCGTNRGFNGVPAWLLLVADRGCGRPPAFDLQIDAGGVRPAMVYENRYQIRMPTSPASHFYPCSSYVSLLSCETWPRRRDHTKRTANVRIASNTISIIIIMQKSLGDLQLLISIPAPIPPSSSLSPVVPHQSTTQINHGTR